MLYFVLSIRVAFPHTMYHMFYIVMPIADLLGFLHVSYVLFWLVHSDCVPSCRVSQQVILNNLWLYILSVWLKELPRSGDEQNKLKTYLHFVLSIHISICDLFFYHMCLMCYFVLSIRIAFFITCFIFFIVSCITKICSFFHVICFQFVLFMPWSWEFFVSSTNKRKLWWDNKIKRKGLIISCHLLFHWLIVSSSEHDL
jgi:hypothetical protein